MDTQHVIVLPYDEQWEQDFLKIKAELNNALGQLAIRIEHVGSTSVQGLSAKPVIDIDVVIKDYNVLEDVIDILSEIGYQYEGNLGIVGREAFKYDGKEHLQKHHLYVCPEDSPELKRHIAFRDYLRTHPDTMREYGHIKEEGAQLYPDDIGRYIQHKSAFIERIYSEIGV
ncbi:MAG: GrpB family protein [Eubacterium sp.]|nr:GrpB family protein [Eubacterium sp.]